MRKYKAPTISVEYYSVEESIANSSKTDLIFKGPDGDAPHYEEFIQGDEYEHTLTL